jgi:2-succinyl-6-hydroxy-2,4-cyclohexadiene-1-carboxylate synthase
MTLLATTTWGTGPRLVLCHGFTQTKGSWGAFGEALGEHRSIVAVDLPGHGDSRDIDLDVVGAAHALLDTVGDQPFDLLGYSMGGRVALTASMMQPEALGALILIGATPGIADRAERAARREQDTALADLLESSDDLEGFLDRWLAQPLFAGLSPEGALRDARLANTTSGLAASLRHMGTATQQPAWGFLDMITVPCLLLAGESDEKFSRIASEMAQEMALATLAIAPGAGHACHLEQPRAVADVIERWLELTHASASPNASSTPTSS